MSECEFSLPVFSRIRAESHMGKYGSEKIRILAYFMQWKAECYDLLNWNQAKKSIYELFSAFRMHLSLVDYLKRIRLKIQYHIVPVLLKVQRQISKKRCFEKCCSCDKACQFSALHEISWRSNLEKLTIHNKYVNKWNQILIHQTMYVSNITC